MSFKILEHPADVGVVAYGKSFENALEEAGRGMFSLMGKGRKKEKLKISIKREKKDELVVFLFSKILAQCEVKNFTPVSMKVDEYINGKMVVSVFGEYKTLKNIIKGITFYMLEIKKEYKKWKIQIIFDV